MAESTGFSREDRDLLITMKARQDVIFDEVKYLRQVIDQHDSTQTQRAFSMQTVGVSLLGSGLLGFVLNHLKV